MATSVAGKTSLITGAGRGIGRPVVLGLAASLILVARSAGQLAQTRVTTTLGSRQLILFRGDIPDKP